MADEIDGMVRVLVEAARGGDTAANKPGGAAEGDGAAPAEADERRLLPAGVRPGMSYKRLTRTQRKVGQCKLDPNLKVPGFKGST